MTGQQRGSGHGRPQASPPPVVIPAHGRGSRMGPLTDGRPKTLLEVAGEPMLRRLLRAAAECDRRVLLYTQEGDTAIPAFLAGTTVIGAAGQTRHPGQGQVPDVASLIGPGGGTVALRRREPHGYLADLMAIAAEVGDDLTVLDSDMVVPHGELCEFLIRSRAENGTAFLAGQAAQPPSDDPRSIRIAVDSRGRASLAPGSASLLPRTVGAYHWPPPAIRLAREFLRGGTRSFHDFMTHLVASLFPVETFTFSAGLNVNSPGDLDLATECVRGWAEANPAGSATIDRADHGTCETGSRER